MVITPPSIPINRAGCVLHLLNACLKKKMRKRRDTEMTKSNSGIIKFSIGVTGHRNVAKQSYKLLRRALETQIQDIQNRFSTLPVEIICGLAEGADILVAQVALEMGIHVGLFYLCRWNNIKRIFRKLD